MDREWEVYKHRFFHTGGTRTTYWIRPVAVHGSPYAFLGITPARFEMILSYDHQLVSVDIKDRVWKKSCFLELLVELDIPQQIVKEAYGLSLLEIRKKLKERGIYGRVGNL